MEFIIEHWYTIALILVFIGGGVISVVKFAGLSKNKKYESVQGWLLQAVLMAEREFGAGTGKLKLSSVYAEFCKQIPWLAKIIPFETFSKWVDNALEDMKDILAKNNAIAQIVEGE